MMDDTSGSTSQLWAISAVPTFLPGIGSTSWELIKMLPIAFFFFLMGHRLVTKTAAVPRLH